jgi:Predicted membrane protein
LSAAGDVGVSNRQLPEELPIALLAGASAVLVLVLRLIAARGLPLTLDETFTAVITSQSHVADFVREARRDVAAPLYYTVLWLLPTAQSDFALRLPSWIFMMAAAAVPLAWRIPGQSRAAAITWAALLFLWLPGAIFATQARPYALLFLVATAQTIAFARLIDEPSLRRAFVWTGSASLTILTHYMGATLGLAQGLVLLAVMRTGALKLWPALLVLLVPAVEAITRFRVLLEVATGDANWFPQVSFGNLRDYVIYGFGALGPLLLMLGLASRYLRPKEPMPRPATLASVAGLLALAMLLAAGWGRPLIVDRYLTPCAPAADACDDDRCLGRHCAPSARRHLGRVRHLCCHRRTVAGRGSKHGMGRRTAHSTETPGTQILARLQGPAHARDRNAPEHRRIFLPPRRRDHESGAGADRRRP